MTENEFLITRAVTVFNLFYGKNIKVADCDIFSIPTERQFDRGYEITTPNGSRLFRIRYYFKFGTMDRETNPRLEVTPPYLDGQLGDEVYVIIAVMDNYWRTQGGYRFEIKRPDSWPLGIITTELGVPILTETGAFIVVESALP